jgi:hypothetical protein
MATSVDQPNPAIVARAGTYCRNETARRAPRVWGRRKEVSSNRSSVVWLLFKSPSSIMCREKGQSSTGLKIQLFSSPRLCSVPGAHCSSFGQCCVDSLPEKPGTTGTGTTEPGPAELSTPATVVSRLSVPVFLHLHLSSKSRRLVLERVAAGSFPGCSHS